MSRMTSDEIRFGSDEIGLVWGGMRSDSSPMKSGSWSW